MHFILCLLPWARQLCNMLSGILVAARMLISGPLMLAYVYCFDRAKFKVDRAHYGLFAQAIILQIYLAYVLQFWALSHMNSSMNALLFTLAPFITAIICYVLYRETLTVKKIIGLSIGFFRIYYSSLILLRDCALISRV